MATITPAIVNVDNAQDANDAPVVTLFPRKERIFLDAIEWFTHVVNVNGEDVEHQVRVVTATRNDRAIKNLQDDDKINIFGHRAGLIDVVLFKDLPLQVQGSFARATS